MSARLEEREHCVDLLLDLAARTLGEVVAIALVSRRSAEQVLVEAIGYYRAAAMLAIPLEGAERWPAAWTWGEWAREACGLADEMPEMRAA